MGGESDITNWEINSGEGEIIDSTGKPILVKAILPTGKPMQSRVKAISLTKKPLPAKAMLLTGKPINMGVKAILSTEKPIIVNNIASVSGLPINLPPPTKKGSAAFERNQARLDTRNDADEQLMSKSHLSNKLSSIFNPPVYTPDDEAFVPSNWFLKAIAKVARLTTPTPNKALFKFLANTDSVDFNTQVLKNSGNDFVSIIDQNQDTSLSYSSEFRSFPALYTIYRHHDTFLFF